MTTVDGVELAGGTMSSNLSSKKRRLSLLLGLPSWENQEKVASKMLEIEIFLNYSETDMVTTETASQKLWKKDTNMQVFNIVVNVGLVTLSESMVRDQILNVI
jgi:hypothetical protein